MTDLALVSRENNLKKNSTKIPMYDYKQRVNGNIGKVGEGSSALSYVAISRKIDIWEKSFYQLEEMVTDLE